MKVGKESIVGLIAALEAWEVRDHAGIRARETAVLELWRAALANQRGIETRVSPDSTANPVDRLEVRVSPESGFTAYGLVSALAAGDPPIMVRGHQAEQGRFWLDPCNLHPGEAEIVAERLSAIMASSRPVGAMATPTKSTAGLLSWPD